MPGKLILLYAEDHPAANLLSLALRKAMSAEVSIQTLFSRLRLAHFLVYLPEKGWLKSAEPTGSQIRFELIDDEDEAPYVILLPRSDQAARSARLMQNAIHNLSGVEGRQPQEIIHDILSLNPQSLNAKPADSHELDRQDGKQRVALRFRNTDAEMLTLQVASRPAENVLMRGEAIEIVCELPKEGPLEIDVRGGTLRILDRSR